MKLTPEQRYTAYCIMLAEAERQANKRNCYFGFLHMLNSLFPHDSVNKFPELLKRVDDWYYRSTRPDAWQQRCAILREIIEELEKKLYT